MSTDISYIKEKCQKVFVHTCTPGYPKYLYWYIFDNSMNYNFLKGKRTGNCEDVHECGYTCIPSSASLICHTTPFKQVHCRLHYLLLQGSEFK